MVDGGCGHRGLGGYPSAHSLVLGFVLCKMGMIQTAAQGMQSRRQRKDPGTASWIQIPAALSLLGT